MADWYQRDGDFPYQDWCDAPDTEHAPYPVSFWKQRDGDFPFVDWSILETSEEIPDNIWKQRDGDFPFLDWADLSGGGGSKQYKGKHITVKIKTYKTIIILNAYNQTVRTKNIRRS